MAASEIDELTAELVTVPEESIMKIDEVIPRLMVASENCGHMELANILFSAAVHLARGRW